MFIQAPFIDSYFASFITAIWKLPRMYSLMQHQVLCHLMFYCSYHIHIYVTQYLHVDVSVGSFPRSIFHCANHSQMDAFTYVHLDVPSDSFRHCMLYCAHHTHMYVPQYVHDVVYFGSFVTVCLNAFITLI